MPQQSDRHISMSLTNLSVAFIQNAVDFVARTVFPQVSVAFKADEYFTYDRADWMRIVAKERAPKTESAGGDFSLSTDTYVAKKYAVHYDVSDDERANADVATNPDGEATDWVTEQLLRLQETQWGTSYFAAGIWTGDQLGVAAAPAANQFLQWDVAGSTPIEDIDAQRIAIAQITGRRPNGILTTPAVFNALKNHVDILNRFVQTQRGIINEELLAALFGVDEFVVAWGIGTTSEEDAATDTFDFLLGKNLLLYYKPPNPGLRVPSAGYTFAWTGLLGTGSTGGRVKRFRIEEIESDRVEGELAYDQKVVAPDLATFFEDAVS